MGRHFEVADGLCRVIDSPVHEGSIAHERRGGIIHLGGCGSGAEAPGLQRRDDHAVNFQPRYPRALAIIAILQVIMLVSTLVLTPALVIAQEDPAAESAAPTEQLVEPSPQAEVQPAPEPQPEHQAEQQPAPEPEKPKAEEPKAGAQG